MSSWGLEGFGKSGTPGAASLASCPLLLACTTVPCPTFTEALLQPLSSSLDHLVDGSMASLGQWSERWAFTLTPLPRTPLRQLQRLRHPRKASRTPAKGPWLLPTSMAEGASENTREERACCRATGCAPPEMCGSTSARREREARNHKLCYFYFLV